MALIVHIAVALGCYWLYQHTFKRQFNRLMGAPATSAGWVWCYSKALALFVVLPYSCAELLLMGVLDPAD